MMIVQVHRRIISLSLLSCLSFICLGCSPADEATVEGTVTLGGKPVTGLIMFENVDGMGRSDGAAITEGKFRAEKVKFGEKVVKFSGGYEFVDLPVTDAPDSPTNRAVTDAMSAKHNVKSEIKLNVDKPLIQHDFKLDP